MNLELRTDLSGNISRIGASLLLTLSLAGCSRGDDVKVQTVPKEDSPAAVPATAESAPAAAPMDFHAQMNADVGAPQVKWTLPAGWSEKPLSQMRAGSFNVSNKNGQPGDVSIIPLPPSGREVDLVNMWRQQMQLPPISSDTADAQAESVMVGPDSGKLFDIASEQPIIDGTARGHMLVAMVTHGPMNWFFKMTGEDAFVREQKPVFLQFLKSISFENSGDAMAANPHAMMSSVPATVDAAAQSPASPASTSVPAGWQAMPATQFLLAKYQISGAGDAKAEVNVSSLAGEGGGLYANVIRWRRQLGLGPVDESDLANQTTTVDVPGGKATFVDFSGTDAKTGKPARLIGAVVPQGGQTWFFKLMGDGQVVEQQKDAFTKFVQNANYSNAP